MTQQGENRVNLHQLLKAMVEKGASDMHITAGAPPLLRIDGEVIPLKLPPLTPIYTKHLCYSIMTEEQIPPSEDFAALSRDGKFAAFLSDRMDYFDGTRADHGRVKIHGDKEIFSLAWNATATPCGRWSICGWTGRSSVG